MKRDMFSKLPKTLSLILKPSENMNNNTVTENVVPPADDEVNINQNN